MGLNRNHRLDGLQILIAGGGIAGLGAGYALQKRGAKVLVLEQAGVVGGRMSTRFHQGFTIDTGAQFLAGRGAYRNLWRLMDELGMSGDCRPIGTQTNGLMRHGEFYAGKWTDPERFIATPYISDDTKLKLAALLPQMAAAFPRLSALHPEKAAFADDEDAHAWISRTISEEAADYLVAPAFGATFDTELRHLSKAFVMNCMGFMAKGFDVHCPEGGPGAIPRALAERVPVRLNTTVRGFSLNENGVSLETETAGGGLHTLHADALVLALPGPVLKTLDGQFHEAETSFLKKVSYTRGIIVTFCLKERPPTLHEVYGIAFPEPEAYGLFGAAVDHQKPFAAPEGRGLLNCALTEKTAKEMWNASDKHIAAFARAELERSPVGPLGEAMHIEVDRWEHLLPCFYPGYHKLLGEFLHREHAHPRLAFAGDYLAGPFTEAAYASGLRAARRLSHTLNS